MSSAASVGSAHAIEYGISTLVIWLAG